MKETKVWEWVVRLNHWLMAVVFVGLLVTIYNKLYAYHFLLGKVMLGLIIFRVIWGFVGSRQSQFLTGLRSFCLIPSYIGSLFSRKKDATAGHTPLSWLMTFAILAAVGLQAFFGLSMQAKGPDGTVYSHEWSPLFQSESLKLIFMELHGEVMPIVLYVLVGLHIFAVIWYMIFKKQNIAKAMVSGKKNVAEISSRSFSPVDSGLTARSLVVIVLSVVLTLVLVNIASILGLQLPK
ncbi:MAG: cytochrome b/b6 domain-containing protein [Alphaproteobacteria bacterium]|nr:cytochrome b/b6 domain-containing protein [Alphaproteobacteria bacterium]